MKKSPLIRISDAVKKFLGIQSPSGVCYIDDLASYREAVDRALNDPWREDIRCLILAMSKEVENKKEDEE